MGMRCSVRCVLALAGILVIESRAANPLGVIAPPNAEPAVFAQGLRARYARTSWSWSAIEFNHGFVEPGAADRQVAAAGQTGVQLIPVYSVGTTPWITGRNDPQPAARSYPPKDLSTQWQPGYGYSFGLHTFTNILFNRYRGRIDYVVIESEPELSSSWGGTPDEYLRTLATARKAIKEADQRTRIIAAGFSSDSLGLLLAKDWIETGARTRAEAIAFAQDYYRSGAAATPAAAELSLPGAIETALDDPASKFNTEAWPRANEILDGLGGIADGVNFHFYAHYRWLPVVTEWFRQRGQRAKAPYSLPVLSTELGVRGTVAEGCAVGAAELDRLARETFKTIVTAWAVGLDVALFSSAEGNCSKGWSGPVSLVASGGSLRPAGEAFRIAANLLSGSQGLNRAVWMGPEQFRFVFNNGRAEPAIVAAWSESGQSRISATASDGPASAWDYVGRSVEVERTSERLEIKANGPVIANLPPLDFRFATVSGASYTPAVAPESIAAGFGEDLRTEPSESTLAQTWVTVLDAMGIERRGRVFYAGPAQINFQVPQGTAPGPARVRIGRGDTIVAASTVDVVAVAPGLFSANGDGKGAAAANLVRIRADGSVIQEAVVRAGADGRWVAAAVDASPDAGRLVLVLYGTGVRGGRAVTATVGGVAAEVEFAGAHPDFRRPGSGECPGA